MLQRHVVAVRLTGSVRHDTSCFVATDLLRGADWARTCDHRLREAEQMWWKCHWHLLSRHIPLREVRHRQSTVISALGALSFGLLPLSRAAFLRVFGSSGC